MSAKRIGFTTALLLLVLLLTMPAARAEGSRARSALDAADCQVVVSPGESIQSAVTAAADNTVLCVRGGVYYENVTVPRAKTGLTLMAYPGELPIIDGQKRLPGGLPGTRFRSLVELLGARTVFEGFEVRFSSAQGLEVGGNDVIVRDVSIHDNWTFGLLVRGVTQDSRVRGVLVENTRVYSNLRKVRHVPVIYRGERTGSGPTDWLFDPDTTWDNPYWTGKEADIPESALNAFSMTFNDDGRTARIYASSARTNREGTSARSSAPPAGVSTTPAATCCSLSRRPTSGRTTSMGRPWPASPTPWSSTPSRSMAACPPPACLAPNARRSS